MKNILVTGGAGFIGSNFINYLLKENDDYKIVNIDKLTYAGNLENLKSSEGKKNYTFVKGDICNHELINYIFTKYKINFVVNFAAESHVDRSILGSEVFFRSNVLGTNVLLEASRKFEIEKFVQVSTDEVYGSLGLIRTTCSWNFADEGLWKMLGSPHRDRTQDLQQSRRELTMLGQLKDLGHL